MPRVKIIRKGASRPVSVSAQLASHLTKTRNWNYADEVTKVSKPKRAAKKDDAARGDEAKPSVNQTFTQNKTEAAKPEAVAALSDLPKGLTMSAKPMMSRPVRPTQSRAAVPLTSREQLEAMTKADLKVFGEKLGLELKPSEPKSEWVRRLNRYMRRDMRAER